MKKLPVTSTHIRQNNDGTWLDKDDLLATEEPLEIRIVHQDDYNTTHEQRIAVTMRTPGNDEELALGFLITEGILQDATQVKHIRHCINTKSEDEAGNVLIVTLKENTRIDTTKLKRNFYTTSSCGVCGKESIDAIKTVCHRSTITSLLNVDTKTILSLSAALNQQQNNFRHTGGIHAVALYDVNGNLLLSREDVGRHNAMDKIAGALTSDLSLRKKSTIVLLSGRSSFELMQKAAMINIPMVCAIGAPSSLAVATAQSFDITLIGFLRDKKFNIYHQGKMVKIS